MSKDKLSEDEWRDHNPLSRVELEGMRTEELKAIKEEAKRKAIIGIRPLPLYPGAVGGIGWDVHKEESDYSDDSSMTLAQKTQQLSHPVTAMRRPLPPKPQPSIKRSPPPRRPPARQAMHPVFDDDIKDTEREKSRAKFFTQAWQQNRFLCTCNKLNEPPYLCNHLASYFYHCKDVAVGLLISDLERTGTPFIRIRLPVTYNLDLICKASVASGLSDDIENKTPSHLLYIQEDVGGMRTEVLLEKWDTISRFIRVFVDACKSTPLYSECLDKLERRKRMPCLAASHNTRCDKLLVKRIFDIANYRSETKADEKTWSIGLLRPTFEEIALEQAYSILRNNYCVECGLVDSLYANVPADLIPDV